jgi:hypothetical protein
MVEESYQRKEEEMCVDETLAHVPFYRENMAGGWLLTTRKVTAPLHQSCHSVSLTASRINDRPLAPIHSAWHSAMALIPTPYASATNPAQCMQRTWQKR